MKNKKPLILFIGDLIIFYFSIWLTLLLRNWAMPDLGSLLNHLEPFSILFIFWILIIYIAGMYDRINLVMSKKLSSILFNTQVINIVLAIIFFYFIPVFTITPKTFLFIYLVISLILLIIWRLWIYPHITKTARQKVFLIARGDEMMELIDEINNGNHGYYFSDYLNLDKVENVDIQNDVIQKIYENDFKTVIIDTQDDSIIPFLSSLYNLMFAKVNFIDMHEVYEYVFGRIPLSLVKHGWFLKNVTTESYEIYDGVKRFFDIVIGLILFILSIPFYPIIIALVKIGGGRKIFFIQNRIGQDNKKISIYKFRTMTEDENIADRKITKMGNFLRVFRLDEIPQLVNVIKGDLSLVGPRPETPELVNLYKENISYYNVRHLIKPGLSGWAQIYQTNHPHHQADIDNTKIKLSYDLFYIKNRSFFLDFKIGLRTLQIIILRKGK